jgi:hypothetical protein
MAMSTRDDATLSAAERAALAGLESQAEADDPRLAAHLRGGRHAIPSFQVPPALIRGLRTWIGPSAVIVGLALMILAVSQSTVVALAGALLFITGGLLSASLVHSGLEAAQRVLSGREPDRGDGDTDRSAGA